VKIKKRYITWIFLYWYILVCLLNPIISDNSFVIAQDNEEPYTCWYAPNNSFGIDKQVIWNMSWLKNKIKNNYSATLETNEGQGWYENNDKLNLGLKWTNNSYYKIWFNVTDLPFGDHRITFIFDIILKEIFNKTDNLIWINYTIKDETLRLMFNYSDLKGFGLIFKSGQINDNWYFRFRKNDFEGDYSFDPIFGWQGTEFSSIALRDTESGVKANNTAGSGTADNVSLFLTTTYGGDREVWASYYYVTNGTQIGISEKKTVNQVASAWWTFNFTGSPPVKNNTLYYIMGFSDDTGVCDLTYSSESQVNDNGGVYSNATATWDIWINPLTGFTTSFTTRSANAYVSFTETVPPILNDTATITSIYPSNNTIDLCPCCFVLNITVNHINGTPMDIKVELNLSGSWVQYDYIYDNINNGSYAYLICAFYKFEVPYWIRLIVYNYDDYSLYNQTIIKYTITDDINCSESYTKTESDLIFLGTPINVETDFLVIIFIIFFFTLANKYEDWFLCIISSLMLFVMAIYYVVQLTAIDSIITVCFVGAGIYGVALSFRFFGIAKTKKEQKDKED